MTDIFDDDGNFIGLVEPTYLNMPHIDDVVLIGINVTEVWMFMEFLKKNRPEMRYRVETTDPHGERNGMYQSYQAYVNWYDQRLRVDLFRKSGSPNPMQGGAYQILGGNLTIYKIEKIQ